MASDRAANDLRRSSSVSRSTARMLQVAFPRQRLVLFRFEIGHPLECGERNDRENDRRVI